MTASWTAPSDFQTSPGTSPNLAPLSAVPASDPSILVLPDPEVASITSSEALSVSRAPPKIRLSELLAQSDGWMGPRQEPKEIMGPRDEADDEEDDNTEWMVARPEMVVRVFLGTVFRELPDDAFRHRCPPTSDLRSDYPPC
jgi:hypothetical protein